MPRTPVPDHLIHRPEEVERNAKRFDYLCHLAEEVAYPVVKNALMREFRQTAASGAEILTEEATQALQSLAEDAAILRHLDEKTVIEELQQSLSKELPPPNEEECKQHTRDFSQVLMGTWLETLRGAQANAKILELSDCLIPEEPASGVVRLFQRLVPAKSRLPEIIVEALASFAPNEDDIVKILSTLGEKLFAVPRVVDLPFDLAMVGAPATVAVSGDQSRLTNKNGPRVMTMAQTLYISLLKAMEHQILAQQEKERQERERKQEERKRWQEQIFALNKLNGTFGSPLPLTELGMPVFGSDRAQLAAANLSVPLPPDTYRCFAALQGSRLRPAKIESKVKKAMAMVSTQ